MLTDKILKAWNKSKERGRVEIPMIEEVINNDEITEFKYSKRNSFYTIIFFLFVSIVLTKLLIRNPGLLHENSAVYIPLGLLTFFMLITSTVRYFENEVIIRLTTKYLRYQDETYRWSAIQDIYLKVKPIDDDYSYSLVLKTDSTSKKLSLEALDSDYEKIIREVGKYRWNWERNLSSQTEKSGNS